MKFLPAAFVCLLCLTIGAREDILISSVTKFSPLMVAMIFGSMIAGSTPLGGGVVAFPVTVLILSFTPSQGRDFSLLIQSVGMTAASFLIFSEKEHLLNGEGFLMAAFCFFSCVGLVIGFYIQSKLSPFVVNVFYTASVACFAIILAGISSSSHGEHMKDLTGHESQIEFRAEKGESQAFCDRVETDERLIQSHLRPRSKSMSRKSEPISSANPETNKFHVLLVWFGLAFSGIVGGILSSQIGTGADIAWYVYGCLLNWSSSSCLNTSSSAAKTTRFSENSLTAISIIVMACTSVNGSILRVTTQSSLESKVDSDVYEALLACSFIVVFGAPLGSTLLTPSHQKKLKVLFNFFAFLQLVLFGAIKIKGNAPAWACITVALTVACAISFRIRR